jgi:adenylate cyclase
MGAGAKADIVSAPAGEIRACLDRVLASPAFASKRRGELLRYLVEHALSGQTDAITEYGIAFDVLQRPTSFDPRDDSTVRSEMSRLRRAVEEYYRGEGASDPWRFTFPSRGYAPVFAPTGAAGAPPAARRFAWRKWAAIAAAAAAVSAASWVLWRVQAARLPVRSVVVLPFANLTGDPHNDYIADGLTEGLTDALAHSDSLRVVARTSAFQFKGKAIDIREVGRRVNADAAVEGSLRKTENGMRVTVQVNRTANGYHILSRVFDGGRPDLARIERDMALPVLTALQQGASASASASASGGHVPNPEAYDLVLKARALRGFGNNRDAFDHIVTYLDQAIQQDPQYADAYASLSAAVASAALNGLLEPLPAVQRVRAASAKALELDPHSALAYAVRGYTDAMVMLDWKRGEEGLRNAVRMMPQNATMRQWLGLVLTVQGRFPEALVELRTAESLDPLPPTSGGTEGLCLFLARRYDDALAQFRSMVSLHPDVLYLHDVLGSAWEAKGEYDKAMAEYRAADPKSDPDNVRIVHLLAVMGQKEEARRRLRKIEEGTGADPFSIAAIYAALGEKDKAFFWAERAVDKRAAWMIKVHPYLDPLRSDPRYPALLKRAGFDAGT